MDIATLIALNNLNMMNMAIALQQENGLITLISDGKEGIEMEHSLLEQYMGKDCVVSLFNEVGAIKGTLMDADAEWVKVETPKKGTQLINRNMIRNITFTKN